MTLLVLGVVLFAGVHFIPSLAPSLKEKCLAVMGEGGYKGIFSLLLLGAFALMIFGWRSAQGDFVYLPPVNLRVFALALLGLAFVLMAVSSRKSRLRLIVRHPQLTGVSLWGISHLLLNGDSRSIVLFGGLTLWAVVEIFAINKREGAWIKEEAPSWGSELVNLLIAAITIGVIVYIHPWLSGVPVV